MRTALLSALERTETGVPRAFLELGGRPVIAWQADLVRELGCNRIICLCDGPTPELLALQQAAEADGVKVNLIRGPLQLVGLVSADHELLVLADGLVPDRAIAERLFREGRGVATLPAEAGIAAGFERIDAANSWGGVIVARGSIVERLADMPPDSDCVSLILRLALQSGTRTVALDTAWLNSGQWMLMSNAEQVSARENALLDAHATQVHWTGPGRAIAAKLARRLAPGQLERGPAMFGGAFILGSLGAIGAASQEYVPVALLLLAFSGFCLATARALGRFKNGLFGREMRPVFDKHGKDLLDIVAIASLTVPANLPMLGRRIFLPLVLIGLLRLAERITAPRFQALWGDRIALAVILAAGAWLGVLTETMAVVSLLALAFCLFFKPKASITAG